MTFDRVAICKLGAAVSIAAAGIFQVIDQASMIALVVVLVVLPPRPGCWRKGAA